MNNYTQLAFHLIGASNLPMTKNAISGGAMEDAIKSLYKAVPKATSAPLALMDRAAHSAKPSYDEVMQHLMGTARNNEGVKNFAEKAMKSRSGESAIKEKLFAAARTGDKEHFEMPGVSTKDFLKHKANYNTHGKSWVENNAKSKAMRDITDAPRIGKVKLDPAGSMSDTELMPGGIYRDNPGAEAFAKSKAMRDITDAPRIGKVKLDPAGSMSDTELMPGGIYRDNPNAEPFAIAKARRKAMRDNPNNADDSDYFSKFMAMLKGNKNSIIAGGSGGLAGYATGRATGNDNGARNVNYYG